MTADPLCVSCGGTVSWYPSVAAWRHSWVPEGTTAHPVLLERAEDLSGDGYGEVISATRAGFVVEVDDEGRDLGRRVDAAREEIEARGRALRESIGDLGLDYVRPHVEVSLEHAPFEMRVGTTLTGEDFSYPWLISPTWVNADGSEVRVTPGTGAKSAAKKSDRLDVHPAPIEVARPAFDSEIPDRAALLLPLLASWGWHLLGVLYSRGYKPDVHARASYTRVVDVVVLKAQRLDNRERLVAIWENGSFDTAYRLTSGTLPTKLSATDVRKVIQTEVIICSTCGEPPHTHSSVEDKPDCFQEEP